MRSDYLERLIQNEGPATIAAIILESVPGTAGIMVPPPGYMAGVREICDRYGIVFIADEVMAGFGRTGKWFAIDNFDVVPDLMTFAKGVTSGYVPLGGVAINEAIEATFADRAYPGGLTYSGHPLACGAAVATINAMEDEGMVANAARIGEQVLGPGCANRWRAIAVSARSAAWACSGRSNSSPTRPARGATRPAFWLIGGRHASLDAFHRRPSVTEKSVEGPGLSRRPAQEDEAVVHQRAPTVCVGAFVISGPSDGHPPQGGMNGPG